MVAAVARQAVSRYAGHGGRPPGRRHLLPLPDAAEPRPRRGARTAARRGPAVRVALGEGGDQDRRGARRSVSPRSRSACCATSTRPASTSSARRSRTRSAGAWSPTAAARPWPSSLRKPLPEDIDFMHATREELVALRKSLQPLSRKLAVRLARKRRHGRKGPLDFRSTMRHSLSTGGVPVDPKFRYPRPSKPEIVVIADISGSVASFARFTLHLVHAIRSQFSKVRSFVFIDGIDEVTRFFEGADDPAEAVHRINTEADVIWVDGHSDYGHALDRVLGALGRGDHPEDERAAARGRPQQLPRIPGLGGQGAPGPGPPRLLAQPRAADLLGLGRLDRRRVRRPLRRRWSSAAPSASSSGSSGSSRERRTGERVRRRFRRTVGGHPSTLRGPSARRGADHRRARRPARPGSSSCATARRCATCRGSVAGRPGVVGSPSLGGSRWPSFATGCARRVSWRGASAFYASVLPRAIETATGIAAALSNDAGAATRARDRVRPLRAPPRGGGRLVWEEFTAAFGGPDWDIDPCQPIAPGGESWTGFVRRVAAMLDVLAARHPGELVVVA